MLWPSAWPDSGGEVDDEEDTDELPFEAVPHADELPTLPPPVEPDVELLEVETGCAVVPGRDAGVFGGLGVLGELAAASAATPDTPATEDCCAYAAAGSSPPPHATSAVTKRDKNASRNRFMFVSSRESTP